MELDTEPWWKLFDREETVGYMKKCGRFSFFSADGYGWSGTPKHADFAVREIPGRDQDNHRLFEGDVIVATWMGRQDTYLTLQDREGNSLIGSTGGVLVDVTPEEMRRDLFMERNLGNVFVSPGLKADFDKCIRKFQTRGKSFVLDKFLMSATVTATVLLGCVLQLRWLGGIGPILTIISLLVGIGLYLFTRKCAVQNWMTRGAIFAITPTVSATVALVVSTFFAILMQSPVNSTEPSIWLVVITLWITLFLLCFGAIPITAQFLGFYALDPTHKDTE